MYALAMEWRLTCSSRHSSSFLFPQRSLTGEAKASPDYFWGKKLFVAQGLIPFHGQFTLAESAGGRNVARDNSDTGIFADRACPE